MNKEFLEDVRKLVQKAYDTGHLAACWEDGGWPTNEDYNNAQEDLKAALESFTEKYDIE